MSSVKFYSMRLLSPFRGMLQVAEQPYARAFSEDGFEWQIQVRVETRNPIWGELYGDGDKRRFMVFGSWNKTQGLIRLPFDPMADINDACQKAEQIINELPALLDSIPFPSADKRELWLLDQEDKPVVLLASIRQEDELPRRINLRWDADDHRVGLNKEEPDSKFKPDTTLLSRQVNQASKPAPHAQWFIRDENGSGMGQTGINLSDGIEARRLTVESFPPLLLSEEWDDAAMRELVGAYYLWHAPRLLTLQNLQEETRARLEKLAARQALLVEKYFRLYPCILQPELLDSARVEAKIRRGA